MAACSSSKSSGKGSSGSSASGSSTGSAASGSPINIALLAPLTGGNATIADQQQNVAEMEADQVNAAGGINGHRVVIKTYDTQLKPEIAAQQAQRAITQDSAAAIIGPWASAEALAIQSIADRSKTVTITGSASTASITAGQKYMFRTSPLSDDLSLGLVKVGQALKAKKLAVLYDSSATGLGFKTAITNAAKANNYELGTEVQYTFSATSVSAEVTKVVQSNADAVAIAGSVASDYGLIAKAMVEQGLKVPLIGFSPISLPDALKIAGDAYTQLPSVYTISTADTTKPQAKAVLADYNAKFAKVQSLPEQCYGIYDALRVVVLGLKKTNGVAGEALATALEQLPASIGANGKTGAQEQFTPDRHDALSGLYVVPYKITNGVPVQDTSLNLG